MIREYKETDLDKIQEIDFMLGLNLQWNRAFHAEDAFVAVDEMDQVIGVVALSWDGTWYYIDKDVTHIPQYRMQMEMAISPECKNVNEVKKKLINKATNRFSIYEKKYPGKELCLRCWCTDQERADMQDLLELGFIPYEIIMVLSFDLTKEIPKRNEKIPMEIGVHNCDEAGIKAYLKANKAGYDNIQDSEDEFRFRLGGEETKVFTARVNEDVISSCTIWEITKERYATENVFTIPEYRKKGIGSETLFTALRYLKEKGVKEATLTVLGRNRAAISMYLSMGYRLRSNMYEMQYQSVNRER